MNHRQQIREQSFKSLSHPLAIGAIILLLLNDHWLRWNYPSWWTGKIGDVAWLIFAPFLLTFMLSYLLPKNKLRYSATIAFIGVGLIFGLGNTIPAFHNFIVSTFQMVAGWQPQMYLDPTDLLTLPALLIGWKIWQTNKTIQHPRPFYKHTVGWLMLSIGMLGTVASQNYDEYGVYCVIQQDGDLVALIGDDSANWWYKSVNGGVTWNQFDGQYLTKIDHCKKSFISPEGQDSLEEIVFPRPVNDRIYDGVDYKANLQDRLSNEWALAFLLACLSISILLIPIWSIYGWKIVVIISTVSWIILSLFGKESIIITFLIYAPGQFIYPLLAIIGGVELGWHHSGKTICLILGTTLIAVVLFMMPLIFWAVGIIPIYQFAITFSVFVAFMPIGYTFQHINQLAD